MLACVRSCLTQEHFGSGISRNFEVAIQMWLWLLDGDLNKPYCYQSAPQHHCCHELPGARCRNYAVSMPCLVAVQAATRVFTESTTNADREGAKGTFKQACTAAPVRRKFELPDYQPILNILNIEIGEQPSLKAVIQRRMPDMAQSTIQLYSST